MTRLVYGWDEFTCKKHSPIPIFLNKELQVPHSNPLTCQLAKEDLSFSSFQGYNETCFSSLLFFPEKLALFDEKHVNDSLRG